MGSLAASMLASLVLALAVVAGAAGVGAATPVTLATVDETVFALAQDGPRVAWRACRHVAVRDLATGRDSRVRLRPSLASPPCLATPGAGLAVGGPYLAWTEAVEANHEYRYVHVASRRDGRSRMLMELSRDQYGEGDSLSDLAFDGETIVHARARYQRDPACVDENLENPFVCERFVVGGGVWRIGRTAVRIPRLPPTTRVAVASGRIVLAPAAAPSPIVELRSLRTGELVSRAELDAPPLALALSPAAVAILVDVGPKQIVVLDPVTGDVRRRVPVPHATDNRIVMSGRSIAYNAGSRILVTDVLSGRTSVVATAARRPVALSLEGRRLVWAETREGKSRIRSLTLPG